MATKKASGAVMTVEHEGEEDRDLRITLTCSHGTVSRRFNTKKVSRLGAGFFKSSVALGHDARFHCDCDLSETAKPVRKPRAKKVVEV